MEKFVLVVPNNEQEKLSINKHYINKLKKLDILYYICDYNLNNISFDGVLAIILTGGGDINSNIYYEEQHIKTNNIDDERDFFEINLIKKAYEKNIPVLGICRGIQIMNVAFGGTIIQHIEGHLQKEDRTIATHYVDIDEKSNFYNILKKDKIQVNSIHHQVVGKLAKGFKVFATAGDIIEGIEYIDENNFFMAMQWHPEALYNKDSEEIFKYFFEKIKMREQSKIKKIKE